MSTVRVRPARVSRVVLLVLCSVSSLEAEETPRFVAESVFTQDVAAAAVHPSSASMIAVLDGLGGFGLGRMQIDFSLHVVHADPGSPTRTVVDAGGYYTPDCDALGTAMPVPADAAIEGQLAAGDLECDNGSADCHLLVVQGETLYEAYAATEDGPGALESLCLAIWHLDAVYPEDLRGDHCTSADAAGFPIAPLLFNADDIAASLAADPMGGGDLGHAIRFILPNDRMANDGTLGGQGGRLYVRPATHAGSPSGPVGSIPFGARLRLRADFPETGYSAAAKVVLNTFKRYGIVLSDGGLVALTAESDLYTDTSWADLDFGPHELWDTAGATAVTVNDFEVIDTGPRIAETWNCVRNTIEPPLFADSFESGDLQRWSAAQP